MPTDSGGAAEVAGSVMPLLLCTFMIVSMQLGFAMLEVGCVRQEHRMTVLAKNLLDTMVSSLSFSLGCEIFQPSIVKQDGVVENHLIFLHWAFLSTSVTICSGSMAERAHLAAYLCYAVLMSGLAYPILADSVWGDGTGAGFLYHQFHPSGGHSYYDYAGGGVIHLAGAMAALAGNLLLGRRILRPPPKDLSHTQGDDTAQLKEAIQETWQRRFDRAEDDEKEFRPNSYLQVMGVLNLWVGCYGFNASPAFVRRDPHRVEIAALSAWNTTLAAGAGACGTFLHSCIFHKNMQLGFLCNGLLSGLVCLTVACDILTPAATVLLGFLCGFLVYPAGSYALKKMRIDDPADAIPVHGGSAIFGILSVAFCTPSCDTESGSAYGHHLFCADHHTIGGQLLVQLLGVGTILVWISCVIFPVWAVFLVSEFVYALELEQLSDTYERAACHVDLEAARLSLEEDFWTGAARNSRITRHLLRQHGWNWIGPAAVEQPEAPKIAAPSSTRSTTVSPPSRSPAETVETVVPGPGPEAGSEAASEPRSRAGQAGQAGEGQTVAMEEVRSPAAPASESPADPTTRSPFAVCQVLTPPQETLRQVKLLLAPVGSEALQPSALRKLLRQPGSWYHALIKARTPQDLEGAAPLELLAVSLILLKGHMSRNPAEASALSACDVDALQNARSPGGHPMAWQELLPILQRLREVSSKADFQALCKLLAEHLLPRSAAAPVRRLGEVLTQVGLPSIPVRDYPDVEDQKSEETQDTQNEVVAMETPLRHFEHSNSVFNFRAQMSSKKSSKPNRPDSGDLSKMIRQDPAWQAAQRSKVTNPLSPEGPESESEIAEVDDV